MLPTDAADDKGTGVSRRRVLESAGVAGVGATGIAGATARTSAPCEPRWETETCVVTVEEAPLLEACGDDDPATVPAGTEAIVLDYTCCAETDEYYYVEWCESDYPEGWVAEAVLERAPSCCGTCSFRWEVETCVTTTGAEVPVYEEECAQEPGAITPSGAKGVIHERVCCEDEEGNRVPRYGIEWCHADLPDGWVTQTDLTASDGCCDSCEPRWGPDTCVETAVDGVPIFDEECSGDPIELLPQGMQATVLEGGCCEGPTGPTPGYYVDWCDSDLEIAWIRQADLVESSGCCGTCEPQWGPETCVETAGDEVPIFDEECSGDPFEYLPQGVQATILESGCCEGADGPTPGYYVDWCDPDLPVAWIREADLVESSGCCEQCTFEWDVDDCIRVRFDEPPIFDAACANEPMSVEARAVVTDRRCCEIDGELRPRYALEWCDATLPDGWVDEAAVVGSARCCDCDLQLEPGQCVITYDYSVALYDEPCAGEYEVLIPERTKGVVREGACCEFNGDPWSGYYVEWCDPDLRDGWVADYAVSASDGCCDEQ
ncbi:hypothetical protein [Halovivax limisalsi]|uniref:hypothetical protein n=1 Tax=Halovivax limisalsi TaxID=1453760 RepID=UPI001FFCE2DB|nr:hypothetical protein [Halovivax limisalsi]